MSRRLVSWVRPDRISSPMIITAAVTRSASAMDGSCGHPRERADPLEDRRPARHQFDQPLAPTVRFERHEEHRPQLCLDDPRHLGVKAVHVLEMPEHRAQADLGAGGDLLGAGRDLAAVHQLQHRCHDPRAAVVGAQTTAIAFRRLTLDAGGLLELEGFGRRHLACLTQTTPRSPWAPGWRRPLRGWRGARRHARRAATAGTWPGRGTAAGTIPIPRPAPPLAASLPSGLRRLPASPADIPRRSRPGARPGGG